MTTVTQSKGRRQIATPDQFDGAVLMRVTQSNIRRVQYVDISLDNPLTVIGGDNAQGKTSFLDGILIGSAPSKRDVKLFPIRNGKQEGVVTLYFGDGQNVALKIEKTLRRLGEDQWTQDVRIEIPGYLAPSRVEEFLRDLIGDLAFDPLSFDAMNPTEQLEVIRGLVKDFDFEANQREYDALYSERTDINRDAKRAQAAADAIVLGAEPPRGEDIDELQKLLREAGQKNAEVQVRKERRAQHAAKIDALRADAAAKIAQIDEALERERKATAAFVDEQTREIRTASQTIEQLQAQIDALKQQIAERETRIEERKSTLESTLKNIEQQHRAAAAELAAEADRMQAELDAAGPLPALIDAAEIEARLNAARAARDAHSEWERQRQRQADYQAEADKLRAYADELTARLTELQEARAKAIREAHLPVDGIGFAADHITLNGVPWAEASEAERITAATLIAMSLNPKLRVILIRGASGVGSKSRRLIQELAAQRGYRVIMEVYDETGDRSDILFEDGRVKEIVQKEAAE